MGQDGKWVAVPELTDEFDGSTLDRSKWDPFNKNWKGRAPGWFNPENVSVSDGSLNLMSRVQEAAPEGYPDKFNTFSTSFVRSKARTKYGYIEAEVRIADSVTSSAFWLVHNEAKDWNEIDVFECSQADGHQRKYHMNAHLFRQNGEKLPKTISKPKWKELDHKTSDKVLVAGVDWTEDLITWYIDGKAVRQERNEYWHNEMFVQFDCETMGNWFGVPDVSDPRLPATFRVFSVRTWRRA